MEQHIQFLIDPELKLNFQKLLLEKGTNITEYLNAHITAEVEKYLKAEYDRMYLKIIGNPKTDLSKPVTVTLTRGK